MQLLLRPHRDVEGASRIGERQVEHHLDQPEIGRHVTRRVVALVRVFFQGPRHDVVQAFREPRHGIGHRRRFAMHNLVHDGRGRIARERLLAAQ